MATAIGLPPQMVEQMQASPMWPALVALARATVYDAVLTAELAEPTPAMAAVTAPTLVMAGAGTFPVLKAATRMVPVGRYVEVDGGEDHDIPVGATAALIRDALIVNNP